MYICNKATQRKTKNSNNNNHNNNNNNPQNSIHNKFQTRQIRRQLLGVSTFDVQNQFRTFFTNA